MYLCLKDSGLFYDTIYIHIQWALFDDESYLLIVFYLFFSHASLAAVFAGTPVQARVTAESLCSLFTV